MDTHLTHAGRKARSCSAWKSVLLTQPGDAQRPLSLPMSNLVKQK